MLAAAILGLLGIGVPKSFREKRQLAAAPDRVCFIILLQTFARVRPSKLLFLASAAATQATTQGDQDDNLTPGQKAARTRRRRNAARKAAAIRKGIGAPKFPRGSYRTLKGGLGWRPLIGCGR